MDYDFLKTGTILFDQSWKSYKSQFRHAPENRKIFNKIKSIKNQKISSIQTIRQSSEKKGTPGIDRTWIIDYFLIKS